jgi:hypothetical protein
VPGIRGYNYVMIRPMNPVLQNEKWSIVDLSNKDSIEDSLN